MVDCGSTSAKDSAAVLRSHIEQGCNFVATQRPLWRLRSRIASALDDDDEGGTSPAVRVLSMAFLREPVSRGIATWQHSGVGLVGLSMRFNNTSALRAISRGRLADSAPVTTFRAVQTHRHVSSMGKTATVS